MTVTVRVDETFDDDDEYDRLISFPLSRAVN
jgi:hypothetical protein